MCSTVSGRVRCIDSEVGLLPFPEHLCLLSRWFVKVTYTIKIVLNSIPFCFSIYAYIESNLYM
jgi:hypothetical protein